MGEGALIRKRRLCRLALGKWGAELQFGMIQEECAELIAAINRYNRGRSTVERFIEEAADVEIVLENIRLLFGDEVVDAAVSKKLDRLERRLGGESDG